MDKEEINRVMELSDSFKDIYDMFPCSASSKNIMDRLNILPTIEGITLIELGAGNAKLVRSIFQYNIKKYVVNEPLEKNCAKDSINKVAITGGIGIIFAYFDILPLV